jgi:circadian clock protein KaiC
MATPGPTGQGELLETGIPGLDRVLYGGLQPGRLVLVEGDPGCGKTTLALQFLLRGVERGESCMLITLAETRGELEGVAASHGWSLDGIEVLEVIPSEAAVRSDSRYTMYHPSEVELTETMQRVLDEVEQRKPQRFVVDSLSELRLMAESPLRYRRQILGMKQFLAQRGCSVLLIDDRTEANADAHLHSIVHGAIRLGSTTPEYGAVRRRLEVVKMRGGAVRHGYHDYVIRRGGIVVFPRLVAGEVTKEAHGGPLSSGVAELDALTGGGLRRGSSTLVLGAAGTGKSSLALLYAYAAARRGEPSSLFTFDESVATAVIRASGLGMDLPPLVATGRLTLQQVDPAEMSPGEFADQVQRRIDEQGSRVIVIDSLNGYLNAMPSERFLLLHVHELMTSLAHQDVTTLLTMTQHGMIGINTTPVDVSYLADAVILLRYVEMGGEVRKAISMIKNRTGSHETAIRALEFRDGIHVGAPLLETQGVLAGSAPKPACEDGS